MAKITIDIEHVKQELSKTGYSISDVLERNNNGINWQIKFNNSGAVATIYDTNTKKNTVVNGKEEEGEATLLKNLIDGLKCKETHLDELNECDHQIYTRFWDKNTPKTGHANYQDIETLWKIHFQKGNE